MALRARGKKGVYYVDTYIDGVRRWKSTGTTDRKLAMQIAQAITDEKARERFFPESQGARMAISELLCAYLELHSGPNRKDSKKDEYLTRALKRHLGQMRVIELSPLHLEKYRAKRLKEFVRHNPKKRISVVTVWHELVLLRHAFRLARFKWKWIKNSPFDQFPLPNPTKERVAFLTPQMKLRLYAVLVDPRYGLTWLLPLVDFARETAGRRGNLLDLEWSHVDMNNRWIVFQMTKSGKPVGVPMTDKCCETLKSLRKARDSMGFTPANNLVFIKSNGEPYKPNHVTRAFKRACRLAGIENFRFHDLRHDCATSLRKGGVPVAEIKEWLGHSDIAQTMRYAHVSGDSGLRDAARRLELVRDR